MNRYLIGFLLLIAAAFTIVALLFAVAGMGLATSMFWTTKPFQHFPWVLICAAGGFSCLYFGKGLTALSDLLPREQA